MSSKLWTKELILQLIKEFKCHELLYDPKHAHYLNRAKRKSALEKICKALKEYNSKITVDSIKKKMKSLRTQYAQANRLLAQSIQNATDDDEIYQPMLWCYDELSFISDYACQRTKISNLHKVWAELNHIQRKHREEMKNPKTSMSYDDDDDDSLTSSEDATSANDTMYQAESMPSPDADKDDVEVKFELQHEDPLSLRSSPITVAEPPVKLYSEPKSQTNDDLLNEEANMIPMLQQQLQMQTQQLRMIGSMLKSIESLSQQQMKAVEQETAAIERQTEATERQTAALEDLMIVYRENKCDKDDMTDVIYMD